MHRCGFEHAAEPLHADSVFQKAAAAVHQRHPHEHKHGRMHGHKHPGHGHGSAGTPSAAAVAETDGARGGAASPSTDQREGSDVDASAVEEGSMSHSSSSSKAASSSPPPSRSTSPPPPESNAASPTAKSGSTTTNPKADGHRGQKKKLKDHSRHGGRGGHGKHCADPAADLIAQGKAILIKALEIFPEALQYAPQALRADNDVVTACLKKDGRLMKYVCPKAMARKEVFLSAKPDDGYKLMRYAPKSLR